MGKHKTRSARKPIDVNWNSVQDLNVYFSDWLRLRMFYTYYGWAWVLEVRTGNDSFIEVDGTEHSRSSKKKYQKTKLGAYRRGRTIMGKLARNINHVIEDDPTTFSKENKAKAGTPHSKHRSPGINSPL